MQCPNCGHSLNIRKTTRYDDKYKLVTDYLCRDCGHTWSEK